MAVCTTCGHHLGVGRFCVNCGQRVTEPTASVESTAERPAVRTEPLGPRSSPGQLPQPIVAAPPEARYPLFADHHPGLSPSPPDPEVAVPTAGSSRLPWVVGGLALALIAMVGTLLLLGGDDPSDGAAQSARERAVTEQSASPGADPSPRRTKPRRAPARDADERVDLARYAQARVPATAPPNQDLSGNLVRYEAPNLLDGVPETTWRMPGDGSGAVLVFEFAAPVELTQVGLVNGYAKTSQGVDWYGGNRRVLAVEWVFDDGTAVTQQLVESLSMQSMPMAPVTTSTVTLRLVEVSEPGSGSSARDYTAISDVALVGIVD